MILLAVIMLFVSAISLQNSEMLVMEEENN